MIAASIEEQSPKYLVLTGGVGGAKLCEGFAKVLDPDQVLFAVNTGDDFEHFGLHISPDLDSLSYALSGLASVRRGWGRDDETWNCLETLAELGADTWFQLGDRDLALHLKRRSELASGKTLSQATQSITHSLGIAHRVVPMSDDPVSTLVETSEGCLAFQDYFVRRRCEPKVKALVYQGADDARPQEDIVSLLEQTDLRGIIICPSNPMLSIEPLLAVGDLRTRLRAVVAPVVAVSPIIAGAAVKGPTAKIFSDLGEVVSALVVAQRYGDLLDGFVLDHADRVLLDEVVELGFKATAAVTLMRNAEDKERLARQVLKFVDEVYEMGEFGAGES